LYKSKIFLTRKSSGGHQAKKQKGGEKNKSKPEENEGIKDIFILTKITDSIFLLVGLHCFFL
jgi:hypothetical protein